MEWRIIKTYWHHLTSVRGTDLLGMFGAGSLWLPLVIIGGVARGLRKLLADLLASYIVRALLTLMMNDLM